MDVFIKNIDLSVTVHELKRTLAKVLHSSEFQSNSAVPINFEVDIHPQARFGQFRSGILTLPTYDLGCHFLDEYGDDSDGDQTISCGLFYLAFEEGRREPRPEVIQRITMLPYVDPEALEAYESIQKELPLRAVDLSTVQFGRSRRDGTFSVEWEKVSSGKWELNLDKREFRIALFICFGALHTVSFRAAQIVSATVGKDEESGALSVLFLLHHPPMYTSLDASGAARQRWPALDDDHTPVVAYTSHAMRIVCEGLSAGENVSWMLTHAHVRTVLESQVVVRLGLFAPAIRQEYETFLSSLPWKIAFQVDALARNCVLDLQEVLRLGPLISLTWNRKGVGYAAALIRRFRIQARELSSWLQPSGDPLRELWLRCIQEFDPREITREEESMKQSDTFPCLHATITPTTMHLDGPFPERSNRVMREYSDHTSHFLRVNFVDEGRLPFRLDRDTDDRRFIHRRFGRILTDGLDIAGRHFEFLAYSQSGLKQHAVWFMRPFSKTVGGQNVTVTPDYILSRIGKFSADLMSCPAKYGARISQAFTATEAAVSVNLEEIFISLDINDATGRRSFTDGVGTISADLARDVWKKLQTVSRRHAQNHHIEYPPALQIRCQGSKGMVSVDYQLSGRQLCLRESMSKFEAPHTTQVEIVAAITSPGKFYLNRPLIMMLEGLKIKGGYNTLKELQDVVIAHTKDATKSLNNAATLLDKHGLGTAFKLSSVFLNLHKLGASIRDNLSFHSQIIDFAVHHVLRELKHHARIPVPEGWTLPGVADIHKFLEEGEIFACITGRDGQEPLYLEGDVMIFRSPVIHPGDIQVVRAIGRPPVGSPFIWEPLANCVVFSVKGSRPLASCLAGGDLDGDVFVCSTLKELLPTHTYDPADYFPPERKTVKHPSTRKDIADFVTEYLYSDSVGIIASNWLLTADSSEDGINDEDCLFLAELHSDAVDYPKSGNPVSMQDIPRPRSSIKPDWNQPELAHTDSTRLFYPSQRWLGKLYREIKLPEPRMPKMFSASESHDIPLDRLLSHFNDNKLFNSLQDRILKLVRHRVSDFIPASNYSPAHVEEMRGYFQEFAMNLRSICASFTISSSRSAVLSEEEAIVGTIVAKCTVPRKRKDNTAHLREQTALLYDRIAAQIAGPKLKEGEDFAGHTRSKLTRAWIAYEISILYRIARCFGARAFGLLGLSEIFDAVKQLEADVYRGDGSRDCPMEID